MLNPTFTTDLTDIQSQSVLKKNYQALSQRNQERLEKASQEFESLLVYEMLKEMNKNISFQEQGPNPEQDDVFIKKNQAEKIFNDFLTYERGKSMVESQTMKLGLAETLVKQFSQRTP